MTLHPFRPSPAPTLGVELELQLVDSDSMGLRSALEEVLSRLSESTREIVKPEFFRSCIEVNTDVCHDVDEVQTDLTEKLLLLTKAAAECGVSLAWGGTHPFSRWRDQQVVPTPRYGELADQFQETLIRQLTFGLHVHVGVPSGDAAIRACNGIRRYLPMLLALSANSPFWCGRATGLQSHRAEVMSVLPASGPPPVFKNWDDYAGVVGLLLAGRSIRSAHDLWWDVRPSPAFGTVELRVCDMPPDLSAVLSLTALIQCLIFALSRGWEEIAEEAALEVALRQNRWRAARYGLNAEFFDPQSRLSVRAAELIQSVVEKLLPVARSLGCMDRLLQVERMAHQPTGAERQLSVFERTRDLRAVARIQASPNTLRSTSHATAHLWGRDTGSNHDRGNAATSVLTRFPV